MIRHFMSRQFLGFLAVGGFAALMNWLTRWLLSLWLPYFWAVGLAYVVGMGFAFVLNSLWIFPHSNKPGPMQARHFVVVNLLFLPLVWLTAIALNALFKQFGMPTHTEDWAHAIALATPMIATFLIYKFHIFRDAS